jgi:hypothetical protein
VLKRIARDNKDKRQDRVLRGFRQFDAPVCVIVGVVTHNNVAE